MTAVRNVALVTWGRDHVAVLDNGPGTVGSWARIRREVEQLEATGNVRWVWWSAGRDAGHPVGAGILLRRCWDIAEVHRVLAGGWDATPALAWAAAADLALDRLPRPMGADLFDHAEDGEVSDDPGDPHSPGGRDSPLRADGYLRPDADEGGWVDSPARALAWARAALLTSARQAAALQAVSPRAVGTAHAESAAALLCLELERDGLPVDRTAAMQLVESAAGPRPRDAAHALQVRRERDYLVLRHTPGREATDLRNPAQVRDLLAAVGILVPDTRKWRLEPYRGTHPVVEALLCWRRAERIATTYGYRWIESHIGADDRLRGGWTACDGAGGRMTAQNGLHNLPTSLRPAIAAAPGHVFVRADLGQIEPRVLAAVSRDAAFATATRADDLYAPVSAALRIERPVAKIAVLAAMYGQTSGAAGQALKDLERAYPVAMGYLNRAYAEGVAGRAVRTFGGRRVPMWPDPADRDATRLAATTAARGRFARNAVIQGAAAELFKAWVATVRLATAGSGAQIVLCLHDELLLHVPRHAAGEVSAAVTDALVASARRWTGSEQVRFVADTSVIARWSDAKP